MIGYFKKKIIKLIRRKMVDTPLPAFRKKIELNNLKKEFSFKTNSFGEKNSDKTLAQLYDPTKMPEGLKDAHHQNDLAIEQCYRQTPFSNDDERLEYLFQLYEDFMNKNRLI